MNILEQLENWIKDPKNEKEARAAYKKMLVGAKEEAKSDPEKIPESIMHFWQWELADNFFEHIKDKTDCGTCNFCCRVNVSLTKIEAGMILGYANENNIKPGKNFSENEDIFGKEYCPWIKDGRCSIYKVRPLLCRTHNSDSKKACEDLTIHNQFSPALLFGIYVLTSRNAKENELISMREFVDYLEKNKSKMEEL